MGRFRITYQHEQEDCAAACLAMILVHYGYHVTLDTIRAVCGDLKCGMTMYELNRTATRMGFSTRAVRLSKEEFSSLQTDVLPIIAYWKQSHFIVVYRKTPQYIYIADPALGRVKFSYKEFFEGFCISDEGDGFALLLNPDHLEFLTLVPKKQNGLNLRNYIRPYWRHLAGVVFSLIVLSAIGLILPFLTRAIVDKGIGENKPGILVTILCATLLLTVGRTLFGLLQSKLALVAGTLIDIDIAKDLLLRMSGLPMKRFTSRKIGDMIQRVSDASRIGDYFSLRIAESLFSAIMFFIYGGILLYLYPILFAVFLIGSFLYVSYVSLFLQRRKILDYESFNTASKTQEELIQYLRGMTELKLACAERNRLSVWRTYRMDLLKISHRHLMLSQKQQLGSVFIFQIVDAIVVFLMAKAVIEGNTTLGSMMAVQYIVGGMENPLHVVTGFIQETQSMRIALSRINYIASAEAERTNGLVVDFSMKSPSVDIANLNFSYESNLEQPVLIDVDAKIPAGKTTALVGMSGSGKTTFLKLLLGFYTPSKGEISIDGVPLSEMNLRCWRKSIGAVMQDGYIFSDTIINNVALGDCSPSIERVHEALQIACADFVEELPIGLLTRIGAEGTSLSSGQRQRILLARAIYKRPSLFLLDEATNALDAINERKIYEHLIHEFKGKTVVIAAHRLSTIRNADQILVFEKGRIIECGTHEDLLQRGGAYAALVDNQRFEE